MSSALQNLAASDTRQKLCFLSGKPQPRRNFASWSGCIKPATTEKSANQYMLQPVVLLLQILLGELMGLPFANFVASE